MREMLHDPGPCRRKQRRQLNGEGSEEEEDPETSWRDEGIPIDGNGGRRGSRREGVKN